MIRDYATKHRNRINTELKGVYMLQVYVICVYVKPSKYHSVQFIPLNGTYGARTYNTLPKKTSDK